MTYTSKYDEVCNGKLWSMVASDFILNAMQVSQKKKHHLRSRLIYAPVHGRATFIDYYASVIVFETSSYQSHSILAPVSGKLFRLEHQNGVLYNSLFVANPNKEACLSLYYFCPVAAKTIHLMIVAKPHGATSRIRIHLQLNEKVDAGNVIGYAGGSFETRLTVPRSTHLRINRNETVHGTKSLIGCLEASSHDSHHHCK